MTTAAGNRSEGFYNMDGTLQLDKIKAISRTYVQSAQGTVVAQKFYQNGTFTTSIRVNNTSVPTEIYVNNAGKGIKWYPHLTWDFKGDDELKSQIKARQTVSKVTVMVENADKFVGKLLNITINPIE